MATLFRVDLPEGMSNVKLNSQGRATVQYTVKNVCARPIDGRAVLISLPVAKPPSGPVERGWVNIEGNADRYFDVNREETFAVTISVPPKSAPGEYTFRLETVWVDNPDEGDAGPAVRFEVPKAAPPRWNSLWSLLLIIVLVLAAVGVGLWWWLSPPRVPELRGKTVPAATTALTDAKLTLDPNVRTVQSKPESADKVVSQWPMPGKRAKKGDPVVLTVGASMVTVPMLIGHRYEEAQKLLADNRLTVGRTTSRPHPNFTGGVVFAQHPRQDTSVLSGSAVDISVTPNEKAEFSVILKEVGENKISVIRTVREVTSMGLREAKEFVESAPKPIKEGIGREEAENIKKRFTDAGATVEVK